MSSSIETSAECNKSGQYIGNLVPDNKPDTKAIYADLESIESDLAVISDSLFTVRNATDRIAGEAPLEGKDSKGGDPGTIFGFIANLRDLSSEIADRGMVIANRLNNLV